MTDLTVCTINFNTWKYIQFQEEILRLLVSSAGYRRLVVGVTPNDEFDLLEDIPRLRYLKLDTGRLYGSETHGFGINHLMKFIETEYALLIDPDMVLLQKNWDKMLKRELVGRTIAIGTPYDPKMGRIRDQNFPTPNCFFFRVRPLQEMAIDWRPLSYRWRNWIFRFQRRLPRLQIYDFEVGWRVPRAFRRHGYEALHFDFIRPADPNVRLLDHDSFYQEFHWKNKLIASHQRRTQHRFNETMHSKSWIQAITTYLASTGICKSTSVDENRVRDRLR